MGKYGVGLRYSLVHYEGLDLTKMYQYVMNNVCRIECKPIQDQRAFQDTKYSWCCQRPVKCSWDSDLTLPPEVHQQVKQ